MTQVEMISTSKTINLRMSRSANYGCIIFAYINRRIMKNVYMSCTMSDFPLKSYSFRDNGTDICMAAIKE